MTDQAPDIAEIHALREQIGDRIVRTPMLRCHAIEAALANGSVVYGKLEFLQHTGTFKARGALATLLTAPERERANGVTAVSAGNHAIATAYAASATGVSAKVVMTESANPARVARCRALGAEVVIAGDVHAAFRMVEDIQSAEGRYLVHPFEGRGIALGTGTLGLEICEQVDRIDSVVVPVGGGGLIGGVANAIKQLRPDSNVIGVEPEGADSMHRSIAAGRPESIDSVRTIADSLGAPFAQPYSFSLVQQHVDTLTLIDDDALRQSMAFLYSEMKIAVEPACAASTAALLGPLREQLAGRHVVLVFCGSNIDWASFAACIGFDHAD